MTLLLDLSPDLERRLNETAARYGQAPTEFVRAVVEEKLDSAEAEALVQQKERNRAALRLLRQWRQEDTEHPDAGPIPEIVPLSFDEVKIA